MTQSWHAYEHTDISTTSKIPTRAQNASTHCWERATTAIIRIPQFEAYLRTIDQ